MQRTAALNRINPFLYTVAVANDDNQTRLVGQISIRQMFGVVTCAALILVALSSLPIHNTINCCVLLVPILLFGSLRCIGLLFRPAAWVATQIAFWSVGVLFIWACCGILGFGWCILLLPVAAVWMLQVAMLHLLEQLGVHHGFSRWAPQRVDYGANVLFSASLLLTGCALATTLFAQTQMVNGKGSALNCFWMIGLLGDSTTFDCQVGYGDTPLTIGVLNGRGSSGRTNPDWHCLGLQRFVLSPNRGALHVSHWFTLGVSLVYPAFRSWSWFRRTAPPQQD